MSCVAGPILILAAALHSPPDLRIVGQPRIQGLRAIQAEYGAAGGLVYVEWTVADGEFEFFRIFLNGVMAQDAVGPKVRGVQLKALRPVSHRIELVGVWDGGEVREEVEIVVLEASRVGQPQFFNCLFFGYDNTTFQGNLQITWALPAESEDDPFVETEVIVDDKVNGGANPNRKYYRLFAPDTAITFAGISEGSHTVTLTALTRSYASEPVTVKCFAEGVRSPVVKSIVPDCVENDVGNDVGALVSYEIPWGSTFTDVAVWSKGSPGKNTFLGYWKTPEGWLSDIAEIRLGGLREGPLHIELAGAKFAPGADEPYAISNLPDGPGEHVVAHAVIACEKASPFIRGDVTADGRINMADVISLLSHLFLVKERPACPPSADVDDSGKME